MVDFKILIDSVLKSAPWAILFAVVGVIWQLVYIYHRDKTRDKQKQIELDLAKGKNELEKGLESEKFKHQKAIEMLRFQYEQLRWKEQFLIQSNMKLIDARIEEYSKLWQELQPIAIHRKKDGKLTNEVARNVANSIMQWRYAKGGLLDSDNARTAAHILQTKLWHYDDSDAEYAMIREARKEVRYAIRSDMGLGTTLEGEHILDVAEKHAKIVSDLDKTKQELGVK